MEGTITVPQFQLGPGCVGDQKWGLSGLLSTRGKPQLDESSTGLLELPSFHVQAGVPDRRRYAINPSITRPSVSNKPVRWCLSA
jgi:hypothetical protein